jgi:hypothetical protein
MRSLIVALWCWMPGFLLLKVPCMQWWRLACLRSCHHHRAPSSWLVAAGAWFSCFLLRFQTPYSGLIRSRRSLFLMLLCCYCYSFATLMHRGCWDPCPVPLSYLHDLYLQSRVAAQSAPFWLGGWLLLLVFSSFCCPGYSIATLMLYGLWAGCPLPPSPFPSP